MNENLVDKAMEMLDIIAERESINAPMYGEDDIVAYWHKRGICDGLEMADCIIRNWIDEHADILKNNGR